MKLFDTETKLEVVGAKHGFLLFLQFDYQNCLHHGSKCQKGPGRKKKPNYHNFLVKLKLFV